MFRFALDAMREAICICDEAGAAQYINSITKELTGWQERPALHICCRQIPDDIELNGRLLNYSVSPLKEEDLPGVFLLILREGKSRPLPSVRLNNADDDMRKRDRILAGVALATNQLSITSDSDPALNQAPEILGCSADVDQAYIFGNYYMELCEHRCKLSHDWFK